MEQVITDFFEKSLHIILESRTTSSSSSTFSSDTGFNLALRECPAALDELDIWRKSKHENLVIDLILVHQPLEWDPISYSPAGCLIRKLSSKVGNTNGAKNGHIIERWVLCYERRNGGKSKECNSSESINVLHKNTALLVRSLYATVRLLPAYKMFHDLTFTGQICSFSLDHRVSTFVESFTRGEEAEMQHFQFTSVDSPCGRLSLSVLYRSSLAHYVGTPSAYQLKWYDWPSDDDIEQQSIVP